MAHKSIRGRLAVTFKARHTLSTILTEVLGW